MEMEKEKEKKHFILVHGACHGAWCWHKVATLLRLGGHEVTALDLTAAGVNPKRVDEVQSISDLFQPLMDLMASLPAQEKVIIVAHSYGGLSLSVAMEKFPDKICVAVFATAFMPGPAFPFTTIRRQQHQTTVRSSEKDPSLIDSQYTFNDGPHNPPTSMIFSPDILSTKLYQLCPPEDLTLATMLVRPMRVFSEENITKEMALSEEKYGSVRRVYIVAGEDKIITEDFQRWMIDNNPTADVKVIPDSDHMVMLCKPQEMTNCLLEIAQSYS